MLGHRQTIARRLGDSDAARDHRLEDHLGEVGAQLRLDVLGQPRALVVHRDQQARDLQPRVELAADQAQRLEELDQPLERQVLGLHRDDHAVGGDQGVDRDRAERRRAVEEGAGEALADRAEPFAQAGLGALDAGELDRGARQVDVGGDQPEVVGPGRAGPRRRPRCRRSGSRRRTDAGRVEPPSATVALHCGVEVDDQRLLAFGGRAGGEVDGAGRLADAPLLVRDRVDGSHRRPD